jgi:hypothetical protein
MTNTVECGTLKVSTNHWNALSAELFEFFNSTPKKDHNMP